MITCIWVFIFSHSCTETQPVEEKVVIAQDSVKPKQPEAPQNDSIAVPEGYTRLADVRGNLDKEEGDERVIVYDTPREAEMGTEREIRIYKQAYDGFWSLIHKSTRAVLSSTHGGMMGDPFEELRIERRCIVIEQFGGSREKWNYTHRYRYQNQQWELIGASIRYGAPCDYWDEFDYNLSTGNIHVKKQVEDCDDESKGSLVEYTATHKLDQLPIMDTIYPGNNLVETNQEGDSFYY